MQCRLFSEQKPSLVGEQSIFHDDITQQKHGSGCTVACLVNSVSLFHRLPVYCLFDLVLYVNGKQLSACRDGQLS